MRNWITTLLGVGVISMITYHLAQLPVDVATVGYIAGGILIWAKDEEVITLIKSIIKK